MMGDKIVCLNPRREPAIFWARVSKHSGCWSNAVLGPNSYFDSALSLYFSVRPQKITAVWELVSHFQLKFRNVCDKCDIVIIMMIALEIVMIVIFMILIILMIIMVVINGNNAALATTSASVKI